MPGWSPTATTRPNRKRYEAVYRWPGKRSAKGNQILARLLCRVASCIWRPLPTTMPIRQRNDRTAMDSPIAPFRWVDEPARAPRLWLSEQSLANTDEASLDAQGLRAHPYDLAWPLPMATG